MSWDKAIKFVLGYEGSAYENNPLDLGRETKYGISKQAYPQEDIPNMSAERAMQIYRQDFWDPLFCDELPGRLAMVVFDCAVNQGPVRAVRILQVVLGMMVDGVIGPKTLNAAKQSTDLEVWFYLLQRARLYMQTKTVEYWGHNWGTRLIRLAEDVFDKPQV